MINSRAANLTLNDVVNDLVDSSTPLSNVLRKAYVVAYRLQEPVFLRWIENEMNGYNLQEWKDETFPSYRRPRGFLKGLDPYDGSKKVISIPHEELEEKICRVCLPYPISEIEAIVSGKSTSDTIEIGHSARSASIIQQLVGHRIFPYLSYPISSFVGILDTVRNKLLKVILDLQQKVGDPMTEVPEEEQLNKFKASVVQIINNPQSCVIGAEQSISISWGQFLEIVKTQAAHSGATPKQSQELVTILEETRDEMRGHPRKTVPQKIKDFFHKNRHWITESTGKAILDFLVAHFLQ